MTELFNDDQVEVSFDSLVGEGKKFKTADDLARSKLEADRFIEQLKKEAEEARAELRSRLSLEELSEQLLSRQAQPKPVTPPVEVSRRQEEIPNPAPAVEKPNLQEEVRKLLDEEKNRTTREKNISDTRAALKERFGGDYNATLRQITEELGVSDKFLSDMAATSPQAFLKLVDSVRAPDANRPLSPPQGGVDTSKQFNQQLTKNNAYYQKMRKEDPKLYFSKRIQTELHNEAMRQGPKFFE